MGPGAHVSAKRRRWPGRLRAPRTGAPAAQTPEQRQRDLGARRLSDWLVRDQGADALEPATAGARPDRQPQRAPPMSTPEAGRREHSGQRLEPPRSRPRCGERMDARRGLPPGRGHRSQTTRAGSARASADTDSMSAAVGSEPSVVDRPGATSSGSTQPVRRRPATSPRRRRHPESGRS